MERREFRGERLKYARIFRGKSLTELANESGISKQLISQYENGDSRPSHERLFTISEILHFPYDFFMQSDLYSAHTEVTYFRSLMSAKRMERAAQSYRLEIAVEIYKALQDEYIDFEPLRIPKIEFSGVDSETDEASITAVFNNIVSLPQIESYSSCFGMPYENARCHRTLRYTKEEEGKEPVTKTIKSMVYIVESGNFFKVLQIKDVKTGQFPEQPKKGEILLSRNAAMEMFGTTDCIGKIIESEFGIHQMRVIGVYEDFQSEPYSIPAPSVVYCSADNALYFAYVRLKEGVEREAFIKQFNTEVKPTLRTGNHYAGTMVDYNEAVEDNFYKGGADSENRFQLFISFFALFCAFLGIVSTFWIRTNYRRSEIGIMRSVGASRSRIIGQLVTEALLLVTMAFAVALPLIVHLVASNDFAQP